jgi:hypothetical protein
MHRLKNELAHLHEISSFLGAKNRAADVAAAVPLTCRRRSADIAADVAADVCSPQRPESDFPAPTHMIAYPQNIAPQKASWRFLSKPSNH